MRGSRNFHRGGGGGVQVSLTKKSSDNVLFLFFFLIPQLILQMSNGQFQRNLSFFKVPEGVQHFSRGVQLLIPYRNPYILWFSRGVRTPVPPLDPHLRTWCDKYRHLIHWHKARDATYLVLFRLLMLYATNIIFQYCRDVSPLRWLNQYLVDDRVACSRTHVFRFQV